MTLGTEPRPVPKGARQHSASPLASQAETASQQPVSAKAKCQHHAGLPQGPRPNRGGIAQASMVGETRQASRGSTRTAPSTAPVHTDRGAQAATYHVWIFLCLIGKSIQYQTRV